MKLSSEGESRVGRVPFLIGRPSSQALVQTANRERVEYLHGNGRMGEVQATLGHHLD
jgi:hypothetical protein